MQKVQQNSLTKPQPLAKNRSHLLGNQTTSTSFQFASRHARLSAASTQNTTYQSRICLWAFVSFQNSTQSLPVRAAMPTHLPPSASKTLAKITRSNPAPAISPPGPTQRGSDRRRREKGMPQREHRRSIWGWDARNNEIWWEAAEPTEERRELEIPEQRVKEKETGRGAQLWQEPTESQSGGCGYGEFRQGKLGRQPGPIPSGKRNIEKSGGRNLVSNEKPEDWK